MNAAFLAVARGLRLTHVGLLIICWVGATSGLLLLIGDAWILSLGPSTSPGVGLFLLSLFLWWVPILPAAAGVVVGFIGLVRCLKMPAEIPAARKLVLVAVVLEVSGWVSLLVGIPASVAAVQLLGLSSWILLLGASFSALMLLTGQVIFLRFLKVLAGSVGDTDSARRAGVSRTLFVILCANGFLSLGILAGGYQLGTDPTWSSALATLVLIPAVIYGLAGLVVYDRLLGGLARSVQAYADAPPVNEYESDQGQ